MITIRDFNDPTTLTQRWVAEDIARLYDPQKPGEDS